MTAGGREFQVAGAAQLKDRLPISVRRNGTSRNGTADDRSDRVPLRALMCQLRYLQLTVQDLWDNPAAVAVFLNLDN